MDLIGFAFESEDDVPENILVNVFSAPLLQFEGVDLLVD